MIAASEVLLAVDIGTSGARAAAIDLSGHRLSEVRRAYPTQMPRPGWYEQSPAAWRATALSALAQLVSGLRRSWHVHGISLTGQCPSVALVDARGRAVGPGLTYRDNRAVAEAAELREKLGDQWVHDRTGHLPAAFHIGPKLRWVQRHAPEAWRSTETALQPRDLVVLELSGERVTDGTHAAATLVYDLRRAQWDPTLLDALGIPSRLLPRVARSEEVVGTLRRSVAAKLGLPAGTPIVLGGADSQACAFGLGVVNPGPVSEMAGSSTCLNSVVRRPLKNLAITHYPHVVPGGFTTETGINTTGSALTWVANQLYGGRRGRASAADYARMNAEAAAVGAGSDGLVFLPVLADGERTDPAVRAAITGLSLRHGRRHLARAALEGVAFGIRAQLDLLRADGMTVTELRISGGDARLATWNQIKADVTGLPVRTAPDDAALTGVAMLAGLGTGVYPDAETAVRQCVHLAEPVLPGPGQPERYSAGFEGYLDLAAASVVRRELR